MTRYIAVIGILLLGPFGAADAALYRFYIDQVQVTDLGTLGGRESRALDINNRGEIVGWAETKGDRRKPFLYRDGVMQDLSQYYSGREEVIKTVEGIAHGINDNTQVVGTIFDNNSESQFHHGFSWQNDFMGLLNPVPTGSDRRKKYFSAALGVNDKGSIVGSGDSVGAKNPAHSVAYSLLWFSEHDSPLMVVPDSTDKYTNYSLAINNIFQVLGSDLGPFTTARQSGYLWSGNSFYNIPAPVESGGIRFDNNSVFGLNDAGDVAGRIQFRIDGEDPRESAHHAILWRFGEPNSRDLGSFPGGENSEARDVNNSAYVVGQSEHPSPAGGVTYSAFLWYAGFGVGGGEMMAKLPAPEGAGSYLFPSVCQGTAINEIKQRADDGYLNVQVAGYCTVGFSRHAVRWDVSIVKEEL